MPASPVTPTVVKRLEQIYGPLASDSQSAIEAATAKVSERLARQPPARRQDRWNERDVVLITYADQLQSPGTAPLAALNDWLLQEDLHRLINTVHLLPFCPYSSDDGFSVIDYLQVDPQSGGWEDIARLGDSFELMFDLVLNHCSQHSDWFQAYLRGEAAFDRFFIEADPAADLSQVVRPRSLPLLSPYDTAGGTRHVWTTFSADQVDLNYAEPEVLAQMLRVLLEYAARGARIVRLDAVAFLWKQPGTNCLHLPQTHQIIKLCRDVLESAAPHTLVLTETNVPHAENVSYYGQVDPADGEGDEAHMVYNFSLPPLLLDAFVNGDATAIRAWLENLAPPPPGCTFFNFTASHDGIGMRPLEGLVSAERFDRIIKAVRARGARINTRRTPDGQDVPYELNITYVDALSPHPSSEAGSGQEGRAAQDNQDHKELHARRFLTSQAVMLALRGMPAVYFHSLVGTRNDYQGLESSGQNRRINRHKYDRVELDDHLAPSGSLQRRIYDGYRELLAIRTTQPAFHPDAPQQVVEVENMHVLAVKRTSLAGSDAVLAVFNFSASEQAFDWSSVAEKAVDLKTGESIGSGDRMHLPAGGFVYLRLAT